MGVSFIVKNKEEILQLTFTRIYMTLVFSNDARFNL